jgi:hypothetical protein
MSSIGIEVIKIALQDAVANQMAISDYVRKSRAEEAVITVSDEQTKLLIATLELIDRVT